MKVFQQFSNRSGRSWIRQVEHGVLRVVSLAFSLGSAHAIRWFFSPLDGVDRLQPVITWMIAIGFGVLGYFVSRGLAHRIMNREKIWAYAPICVVVEFVEIFCNYALAAAVIANASWLHTVPIGQRSFLTDMTYVALSIIPLVSLLLAVVDVDLDRSKQMGMGGRGSPKEQSTWGKRASSPYASSYQSGYSAQASYPNGGTQSGYGAQASYPNGAKSQGGAAQNGTPLGVLPIPQIP